MTPVFPQGLVTPVMQAIFDVPMGPNDFQQTLGGGLVYSQTGYTVDSLMGCLAFLDVFKAPLNLEDLLP